jgi:hypothetical protein
MGLRGGSFHSSPTWDRQVYSYAYLLMFDKPNSRKLHSMREYLLAKYVAQFWTIPARHAGKYAHAINWTDPPQKAGLPQKLSPLIKLTSSKNCLPPTSLKKRLENNKLFFIFFIFSYEE